MPTRNRSVSGVRRRTAEGRALVRLGSRRALPQVLAPPDEELWRAVHPCGHPAPAGTP